MSFAELFLTLLVALLVFSPAKLPKLAYNLGKLARKVNHMKQQWSVFWQQQEQALQLEENLKKAEEADRRRTE